jgi:hypothetical protein
MPNCRIATLSNVGRCTDGWRGRYEALRRLTTETMVDLGKELICSHASANRKAFLVGARYGPGDPPVTGIGSRKPPRFVSRAASLVPSNLRNRNVPEACSSYLCLGGLITPNPMARGRATHCPPRAIRRTVARKGPSVTSWLERFKTPNPSRCPGAPPSGVSSL